MDHRQNSDDRLFIKDAPPSPSEETTCASSIQSSSAMGTTQDGSNNGNSTELSLQQQRNRLQFQTLQLGIASSATVTAVTITFVPIQLLVGLMLVMACLLGLFYKSYQRARLEYQAMLQGRGIGDYLPAGVYDQLVNVTLDAWMSDSSFVEEYQFLMLYFLPGVTPQQRESFIDRLGPRHREMLRRQGLGHFLGPNFMRLVLGDERLAARQLRQPSRVPRRLELSDIAEGEIRDDDDDASGLGDDPASGYVSRSRGGRALRIDASFAASPAKEGENDSDDDEEEEENLAEEANVVMEALMDGINSYTTMTLDVLRGYAGTAVRASATVGATSFGVGLVGVWFGFWQAPAPVRNLPWSSFMSTISSNISNPSRTVIVTSTLATGAAAGVMMTTMLGWTSSSSSSSPKADKKSVDSTKRKKDMQKGKGTKK